LKRGAPPTRPDVGTGAPKYAAGFVPIVSAAMFPEVSSNGHHAILTRRRGHTGLTEHMARERGTKKNNKASDSASHHGLLEVSKSIHDVSLLHKVISQAVPKTVLNAMGR
jgi:hypothetical protein